MKINIYKYISRTKVEGPGTRFCIWVQGCSRHCEDCWAKSTWSFEENQLMTVDEIFNLIAKEKNIEGVTFLGGEPFEQAEALAMLAEKIKKLGLSLITFTGGTYEELQNSKNQHILKLLEHTDILIDGKFEKENFDLSRPWVGSSNQRYIFLSDRYNEEEIMNYKNKVEIRINRDGGFFINGMGDLKELLLKLSLQNKSNKL